MPRLAITETDCQQILGALKQIEANITWTQKASKAWVTCRVPIVVPSDIKGRVELVMTVNMEEPSKFSFSLLLNNAHRITGLDVNGSHINKCSDGQRWDHQTHKHSWSDTCPGGHAYTPPDISGGSVEEVFRQFCTESKIAFTGAFLPAPLQPGLRGLS